MWVPGAGFAVSAVLRRLWNFGFSGHSLRLCGVVWGSLPAGEVVFEPGERLLSRRALRDHFSEVVEVAFDNGTRSRSAFTPHAEPAAPAGFPVYPGFAEFVGDGPFTGPEGGAGAVILPGGP